jgi:hypothetical protein
MPAGTWKSWLELGELGSIDVDIDLTLTGFSTGGTAPHLNMVELGKHGRNRTTLAHRCRRRGRPSLPWKTTTFLAARRHDRIDAPSVFDGSIDGESFRTYVERGPRSYP